MHASLHKLLRGLAIATLAVSLPAWLHVSASADNGFERAVTYRVTDLAEPEASPTAEAESLPSRTESVIENEPPGDPFVDDPVEPPTDLMPDVASFFDVTSRWAVGADYVGWWVKGNRVPPLVTTSADNQRFLERQLFDQFDGLSAHFKETSKASFN